MLSFFAIRPSILAGPGSATVSLESTTSVHINCKLIRCYLGMLDFNISSPNRINHPSPSLVIKTKTLTESGNVQGWHLVEEGPVFFSLSGRIFCPILDPKLHKHVTSPTSSLGVRSGLYKACRHHNFDHDQPHIKSKSHFINLLCFAHRKVTLLSNMHGFIGSNFA